MKIFFTDVQIGEEQEFQKFFPKARFSRESISLGNFKNVLDAEIISGMVHDDFSSAVLKKLPNLKMIALRSVGYNNVDLEYCAANNIIVSHVPDYGSHAIAEHVFALLLSSLRKIFLAEKKVENGVFDDKGLCGQTLKGKTIGVIGTGKIGAHVCRIAALGLGMKVFAFDKNQNEELSAKYNFEYCSLEELYKESDIISLHIPLFPETEHMINKESLDSMKDGVILVNTSRGKLIKTQDLVAALKNGKVSKALLDVLENEHNLDKDRELVHLESVLVTPHIAYYTHETIESMYAGAAESIKEFLENSIVKNRVEGV